MLNFFGSKKKPAALNVRDKLPATHAFVTYVVRGGGPQGRVCFEGAGLKTFRTTKIDGMVPGQTGVFTYTNTLGQFTFSARLVSLSDDQAVFNIPEAVTALARTSRLERRAEPRIDTTVSGEWRFKPVGKIVGAWSKVLVSDLSRTSATMTADRAFKAQEAIELRLVLDAKVPIVLDTIIVRADQAGSKYKVGLTFRHLDDESSHVITRFVNKRMTELRSRGLV
jgi:hypothetical protein